MPEFKFGLFTSFILFVWMILVYTMIVPNFHEAGNFIMFVSVIIPVIGIFFGIRERRDKSNFGQITFKEAFKTGIVITFIVAVMIVIFTYVYYEFINPDYVNFLSAKSEQSMIEKNIPREQINAALTVLKYQFSLNVQIIQQLLFVLIGGTLISFILAFLLKKEKRVKSTV
ncbi:MAG: DUF4199 domain-containing protein [Bacteroidetes bacterium]|nr:DUF4199 domain-containing protein [Bacteroidota bacterium]